MKLTVKRIKQVFGATIGHLYIDGVDSGMYTLEDVVRDEKVSGATAIPEGLYKVVIDHSPHFNRDLPRICDVPGFEGVRIHPGNTAQDTAGCILIGDDWKGGNFISRSREAFDRLFALLQAAPSIEIEICS